MDKPSIMVTKKGKCFICGRIGYTERHHIFYGTGIRRLSGKYGLWVYLCHFCHNEPPDGVHFNTENDTKLKILAQRRAMYYYDWSVDEFRKIFRKDYR